MAVILDSDELIASYKAMAEMLSPYVAKESGTQPFETAVQSLIQAIQDRAKAVNDFLANQAVSGC